MVRCFVGDIRIGEDDKVKRGQRENAKLFKYDKKMARGEPDGIL